MWGGVVFDDDMNYGGGGVAVLWWLVSGGRAHFECASGTNRGMEYLLFLFLGF